MLVFRPTKTRHLDAATLPDANATIENPKKNARTTTHHPRHRHTARIPDATTTTPRSPPRIHAQRCTTTRTTGDTAHRHEQPPHARHMHSTTHPRSTSTGHHDTHHDTANNLRDTQADPHPSNMTHSSGSTTKRHERPATRCRRSTNRATGSPHGHNEFLNATRPSIPIATTQSVAERSRPTHSKSFT